MRRSSLSVIEHWAYQDSPLHLHPLTARQSLKGTPRPSPYLLSKNSTDPDGKWPNHTAFKIWSQLSDGHHPSGTQLYLAKRREQRLQAACGGLLTTRQSYHTTSCFRQATNEEQEGFFHNRHQRPIWQYPSLRRKRTKGSKGDLQDTSAGTSPSKTSSEASRTARTSNDDPNEGCLPQPCASFRSGNIVAQVLKSPEVPLIASGSSESHEADEVDTNPRWLYGLRVRHAKLLDPKSQLQWTDPSCERPTEKWIAESHAADFETEEFHTRWRSLGVHARLAWSTSMLSLLHKDLYSAIAFLRATMIDPLPYVGRVRQSVDLLAKIINSDPDFYPAEFAGDLCRAIESALEHYGGDVLSQLAILFVMRHRRKTIDSWYELMKSKQVVVDRKTLLNFAHALARAKHPEPAFDALQCAANAGYDVTDLSFLKACALLLRATKGQGGNYEASTEMIARLFRMGVTFNTAHYNVLILNAVEEGDTGTAWLLYKTIRDHELEPDDHTFTHLITMCRQSNDKLAYRSINYDAKPTRREIHPYLLLELLLSRHHFNHNAKFELVLRFYERHCELQPLRDLGIVPPDYQSRWLGTHECMIMPRPPPTPEVLAFIIKAYLEACPKPVKAVLALYPRFQALKNEGNYFVVPLAAKPLVYNVVLKMLSRVKLVALWPSIVRDMIQPLPTTVINPKTAKPFKRCTPNAYTWNIIVNALARARKFTLAEALMTKMQENNITSDYIAWTSLLSGLSRTKGTTHLAKALHKFERTGFQPDAWTAKALAPVTANREKLETLLRKRNTIELVSNANKFSFLLKRMLGSKKKQTIRLKRRLWKILARRPDVEKIRSINLRTKVADAISRIKPRLSKGVRASSIVARDVRLRISTQPRSGNSQSSRRQQSGKLRVPLSPKRMRLRSELLSSHRRKLALPRPISAAGPAAARSHGINSLHVEHSEASSTAA